MYPWKDQSEDVEYWRAVIPDNTECKNKILRALRCVPYSKHSGVQRNKLGVESCFVCQVEKSDHTLTCG